MDKTSQLLDKREQIKEHVQLCDQKGTNKNKKSFIILFFLNT